MKKEPLFFEPVFKERIWGGTKLRDVFGYHIPNETTGECWAFSAHHHGQSIVKNGEYKGYGLSDLWRKQRELFGNIEGEVFPLLTKILDASNDLSVQVHPDDTYAKEFENGEKGKTECWYVIDCEEGAELIYGHHAKTKKELERMMKEGEWDQLLRKVNIRPGDFFFVPSGTVHAIGKGTLILETQQNSDVTYRMYDYDRKDAEGNTRELHIQQSLEVTTVPHHDQNPKKDIEQKEDMKIERLVEHEFFTVEKWELAGSATLEQTKPFLLCSVIEGTGTIVHEQSYQFEKGDHFLLPFAFGEYKLNGDAKLIISHV